MAAEAPLLLPRLVTVGVLSLFASLPLSLPSLSAGAPHAPDGGGGGGAEEDSSDPISAGAAEDEPVARAFSFSASGADMDRVGGSSSEEVWPKLDTRPKRLKMDGVGCCGGGAAGSGGGAAGSGGSSSPCSLRLASLRVFCPASRFAASRFCPASRIAASY